jgi:hypothetical protein
MRATWSLAVAMTTALLAGASCTTVSPGPDFQVPTVTFDPNYFYCVVEPQIIMGGLTGIQCGNNGSNGCHYSDKVPEMSLEALPAPVTCVNGAPTDMTQTAPGTPAANNLAQVSIEMNSIYTDAPIYLWPSQTVAGHPVQVFMTTDSAVVNIIKTWAATQ